MVRSQYLTDLFRPEYRTQIINRSVSKINQLYLDFDAVVFTGNSGALIVPEIAIALNKPFTLVRKETNSHSCFLVEGFIMFNKYLIIDDFVESGNTVRNIIKEINKNLLGFKECIGVFTYNNPSDFTIDLEDGKDGQLPAFGFALS